MKAATQAYLKSDSYFPLVLNSFNGRSSGTHSGRRGNILSKDDPLGLNNEEVDKFVNITNHCIESFARNGIISAGPDLSGETIVQHNLASDLGSHGDTQDHPGQLKGPSQDIEISSSENQGDDGNISNGRSTRVSP